MYTLAGYGQMLQDRVRTEAYARALRKSVRPGSVVIEIGTGPGAFAVLACQLGARRVYAIEPDPVIQIARDVAAANGYADRIEFIEDLSTRVTLPLRADVIVADLHGVLPLFQFSVVSMADARRRLLAPGGTLIPQRDALWASVVESPKDYARIVDGWDNNILRLDLDPARRLAVNDFQKGRFTPDQLLAQPQLWTTLDYNTIESPDVRGTLHFSIQRPGIGHGVVIWFDACLADGIGFSNAPGAPEAIFGSLFLPWSAPVPLAEGQTLSVNLDASFVENDYVWRWNTQIDSTADGAAGCRFEQSQLAGAVLSLPRLRRSAMDYVPQLSEDGRVSCRALDLMDGRNSLEEIAHKLAAEFPHRFPRWHEALSFAAKRSQEYSR